MNKKTCETCKDNPERNSGKSCFYGVRCVDREYEHWKPKQEFNYEEKRNSLLNDVDLVGKDVNYEGEYYEHIPVETISELERLAIAEGERRERERIKKILDHYMAWIAYYEKLIEAIDKDTKGK